MEQERVSGQSETKDIKRSRRRERKTFDPRWAILLVLLISVFTTAIIVNSDHLNEGADKIESGLDIDNGDTKINWSKYSTTEIRLEDSLNITTAGIYHLTGTLRSGEVKISVKENEPVKLILDNVSITNTEGPAINCESADDLVIELVGESTLTDGEKYNINYGEDVTGAIYSKADLTFEGDGTLVVTANYQDGIVSKDDLKFVSGSYDIAAVDDAIRGKDSVYIENGNFKLSSEADAIKTTNEENPRKGFVLIEDGNFNIEAAGKGVEATNNILVNKGNFIIGSTDDAIHSNNYIGIVDGNISIATNDDGMHADKELIIDGGTINVSKSYEGLEAQKVTINNGEISIISSDDGINAGGGADSSAETGPNNDPFKSDENCILSVNNGNIYINASGDGVDSNGWLYINGGSVVVDGPTNDGNGALDSGMGVVINGGEVLAIGSSGMAETPSSASGIVSVNVYLPTTRPAGTKIEIKDSSNKLIFTHDSAKTFSFISASSPAFNIGEEYTIYLDDEEYQSFTITEITTIVGNRMNNQAAPSRPGRTR